MAPPLPRQADGVVPDRHDDVASPGARPPRAAVGPAPAARRRRTRPPPRCPGGVDRRRGARVEPLRPGSGAARGEPGQLEGGAHRLGAVAATAEDHDLDLLALLDGYPGREGPSLPQVLEHRPGARAVRDDVVDAVDRLRVAGDGRHRHPLPTTDRSSSARDSAVVIRNWSSVVTLEATSSTSRNSRRGSTSTRAAVSSSSTAFTNVCWRSMRSKSPRAPRRERT
jgi:hypothetical protein